MFKRILVPTDGSTITATAVARAIELARLTGAELVALSITEPFPYSAMSELQPMAPREFTESQNRIATNLVQGVADQASAAGVRARALVKESSSVWEGIVDESEASGVDLIVMASHGRRGMAAVLLGSSTQRVLTHCRVPVLVVR